MNVTVTGKLIELFRRYRLATLPREGERWDVGTRLAVNPYGLIESYAHIFQGSVIPRSFGAFSYSYSPCDLAMSVGRYSSIAMAVGLMGSDHPSDWASTSPFSYEPDMMGGVRAYLQDAQSVPAPPTVIALTPAWVKIGNDVTIGGGVMFKRGVTIGDGAIVGARSLVTRDVEPYAIVAGTPARLIRYRFATSIIERMMAAEWWRFGPDVLQHLPVREPQRFLTGLEQAIANGALPMQLDILTGKQIIDAAEPT